VTPSKAVVLAQASAEGQARPGSRPPHTSLPPAALLPVANRALLGHALDWLARSGVLEAAVIVPRDVAHEARRAAAGRRGTLSVSWVEQLPGESLGHVLGDLIGFLDGEAFVLHLADSLAKQSLRSLIAGGADCDTEALLVVDESRGVELAEVVQLRAAVGGGLARPPPLRND
jgi:NDP-sugar pyrophosphorylase family protein